MSHVVGYRVLRTLWRGRRADVLLAIDEAERVALKVFAEDGDPADPLRELVALDRAAGEHVVTVHDVGSEGDRCVIVLEHLGLGSLSALLGRRRALEAGEAVTILVPVAQALDRLHAAGVSHGALDANSIVFRADGAPVLVGFGEAELFAPGAPEVVLETVAGVVADRRALRTLAWSVLGSVTGAGRRGAAELAAAMSGMPDAALGAQLAAALFALAQPRPIRFVDVDERSDAPWPPTLPFLVADGSDADAPVVGSVEPAMQGGDRWWAGLLEAGPIVRLRELAKPRWDALSPRRRAVAAAIAGVAGLVVTVSVLPTGGPTGTPLSAAPVPAATTAAEPSGSRSAVLSDDPLAAVAVLLDHRADCLRAASLLCLETVVQPGSAAEEHDRAIVAELQAGGEQPEPIRAATPALIERLGDSALVSLGGPQTEPASLLLMRSEAGWRIRDYLAGPDG